MAEDRFVEFNSSLMLREVALESLTSRSTDSNIRNYAALQYLLGAMYILIIILSLLGNMAVILAVMIFEQLKTLNHYLLMSLAVADLTVTVRKNICFSEIILLSVFGIRLEQPKH
jgi:hypothetical protein